VPTAVVTSAAVVTPAVVTVAEAVAVRRLR
jgi:hypothetical protein